jgi:hypothetical protein
MVAFIFCSGCISRKPSPASPAESRANAIRGCYGTYGAAPTDSATREKLFNELKDIHANTYHYIIRPEQSWKDLKTLLPEAQKQKIKVWLTLLPPSEPPPSKPFELDFIRWAEEIAKLSLAEPNLVAWSIDDFVWNSKKFTPEYLQQMMSTARAINPQLAFVPCCYYRGITPAFAKNYAPLLDGILFPYRAESEGANLKNATLIEAEVKKLRASLGQNYPIILDVYASAHSRLGASTPEYVRELMERGQKVCDGVLIYRHQDPKTNAEKYQIIKELFAKWDH